MIKKDIYINALVLLILSFIAICFTYYYLFTINEIISILKEEYILFSFVLLSFILHLFSYLKLRKYDILAFIPKLGRVPIIQSILFFSIFEIVDYYYEDGIIGAIKLWYMYWLFGILSLNMVYIFNYFKNFRFYNLKF